MMMDIDSTNELDGRIALVTGGSGDIGSAIVRALARRGSNVAIHYHKNEKQARALCAEIESFGRQSIMARADLTVRDEIDHLVEKTKELGTVDILINNAGTPIRRVPWLELSPEFMDQVFALNFRAPFYLIQKLAPAMLRQRRGVIVNILSSAVYSCGTDTVFAYGAAKGALLTLTRGLARSMAPQGVRVLAVAPGMVDTDIQRSLTGPEIWAQLLDDIPLGRIGQPEEIGEVVAFLATDHASFIVGATVDINGGAFMF